MSEGSPARLYALLGAPVHHSFSPRIYRAAFQTTGLQAVYVALHAWEELVAPLMRELARRGGGGNVTLPHKAQAAGALDEPTEAVRATGACNTFWWEQGALRGDNTDVDGFLAAARQVLDGEVSGRRVLLVGAGGAARAVAHACLQAGVAGLDLYNRTASRAEALIQDLGSPGALSLVSELGASRGERYDLVVNATSLGLARDDPLPLSPGSMEPTALLDLVYGRDETRLVTAARAAGWRAEDGRRMLVEQAAAAFRRWFGREPPLAVMLEAVGLT